MTIKKWQKIQKYFKDKHVEEASLEFRLRNHSMHPTPLSAGGCTSKQIFKKRGDLTRPQLLDGGLLGNMGVTFFEGLGSWWWWWWWWWCNFYIKNKLKSKIFNDKKKKICKKNIFVISKNWNWGILTKNLVTFKR